MGRLIESEFELLLGAELRKRGYSLAGVTWTRNRVKLVSSRARRQRVHVRVARKLLLLGERTVGPIAGLVAEEVSARALLQALFKELPVEEIVPRRRVLRPQGDAFNLEQLLAYPCELLEMKPSDIRITWGARRRPVRRQRTFRLGTYDPRTDVVCLHRILDHPDVPTFYIEFVIFHELIHRHVGLEKGPEAARRHDTYFRELESAFPRLEEARAWEREQLMRHARRYRS